MKTKTIIAPVVHLNGTGKAQLIGAYDAAHDAIAEAYKALRECGPNGRDYYPLYGCQLGAKEMKDAQSQHRSRLLMLSNCQDELAAIIGAITDNEHTAEVRVQE